MPPMHSSCKLMKLSYLLLIVCLAFTACGPKDPKDPKFVVATVNGTKITRTQLNEAVAEMAKRFGAKVETLTPEQQQMLDWQMVNELVSQELVKAATAKITDPAIGKRVDEELAKLKANLGTEADFQAKLKEANYTEAKLRGEMKKQFSLEALVEKEFAKELVLEPNAAAEFYQANPDSFNQKEMIMARHILVLAKENGPKDLLIAAKKKAEAARKEIEGGKSFEEVAKAVSEDPGSKERGGALPPFGRGQMVPPFEKMAFSSPVKKLSPVFQTSFGYHFLEVIEKRDARVISLDEAKARIEEKLVMDKKMAATQKLVESLKTKAKISFKIPDPAKKADTAKETEPAKK